MKANQERHEVLYKASSNSKRDKRNMAAPFGSRLSQTGLVSRIQLLRNLGYSYRCKVKSKRPSITLHTCILVHSCATMLCMPDSVTISAGSAHHRSRKNQFLQLYFSTFFFSPFTLEVYRVLLQKRKVEKKTTVEKKKECMAWVSRHLLK